MMEISGMEEIDGGLRPGRFIFENEFHYGSACSVWCLTEDQPMGEITEFSRGGFFEMVLCILSLDLINNSFGRVQKQRE